MLILLRSKCQGAMRVMAALCLLLLAAPTAAVLLAPRPAYANAVTDPASQAADESGWAQDLVHWLKQGALLGDIIKGVTSLYDTLKEWFDKIFKTKKKNTAVEVTADVGSLKGEAKIGDAINNRAVENVTLKQAMRTRSKFFQPRNQHLCRSILAHQSARTTKEFAVAVKALARTAIDSMYRGKDQDGAGPQYAYNVIMDRCSYKFGSPIDFPQECVDTSTKGTDGRKLADADLSFCTLTGGQVLEVPKFKSYSGSDGITYHVPDPQNAEQKFWVAGLYVCANLAGPRPTPPYGNKIADPSGGSDATGLWLTCKSRQSGVIDTCLDLLVYNTRPNDESPTVMEEQKKAFKAVTGITFPASFENGEKGLSLRQMEFLRSAACKSDQHFISQAHMGAKDVKMVKETTDCAAAANIAEDNQIAKTGAVIIAAIGMMEIKGCWKGVSLLMGK